MWSIRRHSRCPRQLTTTGLTPRRKGDYVGSSDEGQEGEDDDEDAMLGCGGEIDDKDVVLPTAVVALDEVGGPTKGLRRVHSTLGLPAAPA
ncbi:hypothetical protein GUJ93_ZPchr0023g33380 [Zizania palustris]|uniref:Uncharacterized protein n=1 Tax=Zizania palustris TaxID=103762 RepID=A0A8J5RDG5_ZIZPA|nr:hypothetical protein GUJ93_ZPchr0023g33380 [Zizania palustris]